MKKVRLNEESLKNLVKKIYEVSNIKEEDFEEDQTKNQQIRRKIKIDYMVDRFVNRFLEIGEHHGPDFALEVLEELRNRLEEKYFG